MVGIGDDELFCIFGGRRVVRLGGFFGAEEREEDYVADGVGVGEEHAEAVDADPDASSGGHAVGEGADVVLVHLVGFVVAALAFLQLRFEAAALIFGIVEFAEAVGDPRRL